LFLFSQFNFGGKIADCLATLFHLTLLFLTQLVLFSSGSHTKHLSNVTAYETNHRHLLLNQRGHTMPKKHSRAEQRKRFKLEAKRQGISLSELQKRLFDGDSGAQEAEGVRTTHAGQDGVAEEGGNNTPA
jgi:hypothetical protein